MERYYYQTNPLVNGWDYAVFDHQASGDQIVASCRRREDAETVVDALNTRALLVDSVDRK